MKPTEQAIPAVLQAVAELAERGWRLFPCSPSAKTPLLKGWQRLASADVGILQIWAVKHPGCNWAVVTGPESGVFVLDIDGEKGRASLAALESQYGPLPATLTSVTGREEGGVHRWFLYPTGCEIRNSTGKLGQGLDVKAHGGYVIVPPSVHPTGRAYQWAESERPIAEAPTWLIELFNVKAGTAQTLVMDRWDILADGRRNVGLASQAGALRRKGAELPELEAKLLDANVRRCRPPLDEKDVLKIARSIARYPVGGPNPLEIAWKAAQGENQRTRPEQFLALCRQLQSAFPDQSIGLPLKSIGALMGVHWTTVGLYRKVAVKRGWLKPVGEYIAHRRAGHYILIGGPTATETKILTKPLTTLTNGLVRVLRANAHSESMEKSHSENSPVASFAGPPKALDGLLHSTPRCPKCGSFALYRQHNVGTYECLTCDLAGIEESIARGITGDSGAMGSSIQ